MIVYRVCAQMPPRELQVVSQALLLAGVERLAWCGSRWLPGPMPWFLWGHLQVAALLNKCTIRFLDSNMSKGSNEDHWNASNGKDSNDKYRSPESDI